MVSGVFSDPDVGIDQESLTFTAHFGDKEVEPQLIDGNCRESTHDGTLTTYDDCTANAKSEQSWISYEPSSISGEGTIKVSVNPEGMEVGTHEGKIVLRSEALVEEGGDTVNIILEILEPEAESGELQPVLSEEGK